MARSPSRASALALLLAPLTGLACASGAPAPVAAPQSVELPPPPPPAPPTPAPVVEAPPRVQEPAPPSEDLREAPVAREPEPTELGGRLAPSVVVATVKPSAQKVRRCYELALAANPALTGKITVRFVIGRDGATRSASAGPPDFPDPLLLRCVEKVISTLRFPAPEGGDVHVTYPFSLVPDTQSPPSAPPSASPPPPPRPKKR